MLTKRVSTVLIAAAMLLGVSQVSAQLRQGSGFAIENLTGCYGSHGDGDAGVSVSTGVICYDGVGRTTRSLVINAPAGEGERRLLTFKSEGTYHVNSDGTGTAYYTNQITGGQTTMVSVDLVILGPTSTWVPGRGQSKIATELLSVQREGGVTVSLVTVFQKRIADLDD